jgi:thiol-disulfide isomerase/thioredoxin
MTARLRKIIIAAAGVIALGLGVGVAMWERHPADAAALFALSLPDTQGTRQSLNQWRGKVLVVNFWATWCEPCREEMPQFVQVQRELGPKGLQFIGIAVDERGKVVQFASELGLNYPALIGGYDALELSRPLGNRVGGLPFTVIIGREGGIVHTHLGPIKPGQLRSIVGNLL